MNKKLEKLKVPGSEVYKVVIIRKDVKLDEAYYQIELFFEEDEN
jgi:hypothetical protein